MTGHSKLLKEYWKSIYRILLKRSISIKKTHVNFDQSQDVFCACMCGCVRVWMNTCTDQRCYFWKAIYPPLKQGLSSA